MSKFQFNLTGLTCEACVKLVSRRLGKIADVQGVQVDLTGAVSIEAAREISKAEIESALAGTHYLLA